MSMYFCYTCRRGIHRSRLGLPPPILRTGGQRWQGLPCLSRPAGARVEAAGLAFMVWSWSTVPVWDFCRIQPTRAGLWSQRRDMIDVASMQLLHFLHDWGYYETIKAKIWNRIQILEVNCFVDWESRKLNKRNKQEFIAAGVSGIWGEIFVLGLGPCPKPEGQLLCLGVFMWNFRYVCCLQRSIWLGFSEWLLCLERRSVPEWWEDLEMKSHRTFADGASHNVFIKMCFYTGKVNWLCLNREKSGHWEWRPGFAVMRCGWPLGNLLVTSQRGRGFLSCFCSFHFL